MSKFYASLTGPFLGLYYLMPKEFKTEAQCRVALNSSQKLRGLWCSIYSHEEVLGDIKEFGGQILEPSRGAQLDYDYHTVFGNV